MLSKGGASKAPSAAPRLKSGHVDAKQELVELTCPEGLSTKIM